MLDQKSFGNELPETVPGECYVSESKQVVIDSFSSHRVLVCTRKR